MRNTWESHLEKQRVRARERAAELTPPGFHEYRLNPKADNPREIAFFSQWRSEHENHDLLYLLCTVPNLDPQARGLYGLPPMKEAHEVTEEDRRLASTLMQWLGSNIGMSFLRESLGRVGLRIVDKDGRHG